MYNRSTDKLSETEEKATQIFLTILSKPDVEMTGPTQLGSRYLVWGDVTVYITDTKIVINAAGNFYHIQLPISIIERLANKYDAKLNRRKNKIEANVDAGVNQVLEQIIADIKE